MIHSHWFLADVDHLVAVGANYLDIFDSDLTALTFELAEVVNNGYVLGIFAIEATKLETAAVTFQTVFCLRIRPLLRVPYSRFNGALLSLYTNLF